MLKRVVKHLSTNLDSVGVRQARYGVISAFSRQSSSDSCQAGQQQPAQAACRFASAYSDEPTLAKAVTGCLAQVQDQLGPETRLDLCQLLVTLGHGEHLRLAPMYIAEILAEPSLPPPVIIGGVVQGLITPSVPLAPSGVSLLAASLPGTKLYPFHTNTTDLPALPHGGWGEVLAASAGISPQPPATSALLMAEPHFTTVEMLLSRLQSAVPGMGIVGGVMQAGAWGGGHRSMRGAVFHGSQVYDEGAVGCILQGSVQLDTICTAGCRPIGRRAEVTAARGNHILELDGQPALNVMRELWQSLQHENRALPLQIGLTEAGVESPLLARNIERLDPLGQAISVAVDEVQVGTHMQLLIRDPASGRQALEADLKQYLEDLPPGVSAEQGTLGGLLYSCIHSQQQEHQIITSTCPSLPWQGCMVQGEFGPAGSRSGPSVMHSYSSSLGFLRQADSSLSSGPHVQE